MRIWKTIGLIDFLHFSFFYGVFGGSGGGGYIWVFTVKQNMGCNAALYHRPGSLAFLDVNQSKHFLFFLMYIEGEETGGSWKTLNTKTRG